MSPHSRSVRVGVHDDAGRTMIISWRDRRTTLLVCGAALVGAVLRFWGIGRLSLWWDEAFSVRLAAESARDIVAESFGVDCSPPLYYLALHAWTSVFGNGEGTVRSLSALLGIASIFLIYRVGAALFDRPTGALAAWMLALSAFHVEYSQEARAYALLVCLVLASMLAYVRLLADRRPRVAAVSLLAGVALLYSHVYGAFFILAQSFHFAFLCLRMREETASHWKQWIAMNLAIALLAAPLAVLVLGRMGDVAREGFWLARPTLGSLKESLTSYAGSLALLIVFLVLSAACVIDVIVRSPTHARRTGAAGTPLPLPAFRAPNRSALLLIWVIVPLAVPVLISLVSTPMFHTRYAIGFLPALLLLAAGGAMRWERPLTKAVSIALVLALSLSVTLHFRAHADKEPWRDVVGYVESEARPGDVVLADRVEVTRDLFGYYGKRRDLPRLLCDVRQQGLGDAEQKELSQSLASAGRVWLVRCRSQDDSRTLPRFLSESRPHVTRQDRWAVRRIEVICFEP